MTSVVTLQGAGTVSTVQPMCLTGAAAKGVQKAVAGYYDAQANQMLIPPVWNLPEGYRPGQYFTGGLDETCQSTTVTAVAQWCSGCAGTCRVRSAPTRFPRHPWSPATRFRC